MLANGVSPKVAAERLGHSDPSLFMNLYSHLTPSELVKGRETDGHADLMSASGLGSLIQATVGSLGGVGRRWRNLAGLAA